MRLVKSFEITLRSFSTLIEASGVVAATPWWPSSNEVPVDYLERVIKETAIGADQAASYLERRARTGMYLVHEAQEALGATSQFKAPPESLPLYGLNLLAWRFHATAQASRRAACEGWHAWTPVQVIDVVGALAGTTAAKAARIRELESAILRTVAERGLRCLA